MRIVAIGWLLLGCVGFAGTMAQAEEPAANAAYGPGSVVAIRRANLKIENEVVDTVEEATILGVDRVEGDWLWVTAQKSGWLAGEQRHAGRSGRRLFHRRHPARWLMGVCSPVRPGSGTGRITAAP